MFHICCSLGNTLTRLRNIEPLMKELLLSERHSTELIHYTPLTMTTPLLLQQPLFPSRQRRSVQSPALWVTAVTLCGFGLHSLPPHSGPTQGFNALSAKGECRRYGFLWVLALWSSAWRCSSVFLGLLQPPKRIWWCFLLVPSGSDVRYFSFLIHRSWFLSNLRRWVLQWTWSPHELETLRPGLAL